MERRETEGGEKKERYKMKEIEEGKGRERNRMEKVEGGPERGRDGGGQRREIDSERVTEAFWLERCHFICGFISKSVFRWSCNIITLNGKGFSTSFHN